MRLVTGLPAAAALQQIREGGGRHNEDTLMHSVPIVLPRSDVFALLVTMTINSTSRGSSRFGQGSTLHIRLFSFRYAPQPVTLTALDGKRPLRPQIAALGPAR